MDYNYIRKKSAETLIECNVKSFPINCFQILAHYGYRIYTYSELYKKNKELYSMCLSYSEDAFHCRSLRLVAYNDRKPQTRIRFSLMHELGHHVLKHRNDTAKNESEANFFANNMLVPRIAIYYSKVKTNSEASRLFHVSSAVARYAAQDFPRWCYDVCRDGMHDYDKDLYSHFYNEEYKGFVYSIKKCELCGANIFNSTSRYCVNGCRTTEMPLRRYSCFNSLSADGSKILSGLEDRWVYDF